MSCNTQALLLSVDSLNAIRQPVFTSSTNILFLALSQLFRPAVSYLFTIIHPVSDIIEY